MSFWAAETRRRPPRRGAVLAEFAVTSLLLVLLLATILEMGRALTFAQQLQSAADFAAREIALAPLPAEATFAQGLDAVFDPTKLVLFEDDVGSFDAASLDAYFNGLPPLHRALRPFMFFDRFGGERILRYPGALVSVDGRLTVQVPVVTGRGPAGATTIAWRRVVEEVVGADPSASVFPASKGGYAVLRVLYPYQAATLSGYRRADDGDGQEAILADDDAIVDAAGPLDGGAAVAPDPPADGSQEGMTYAGEYGLGRQFALAKELRPFRQVLSAQAAYRREVFE